MQIITQVQQQELGTLKLFPELPSPIQSLGPQRRVPDSGKNPLPE
ncbi:unnamed protein product, partial [Allacma fusca]